jgi:hypothetical protein
MLPRTPVEVILIRLPSRLLWLGLTYATAEDRLAELWRPAKRVALRLALRSTDAG